MLYRRTMEEIAGTAAAAALVGVKPSTFRAYLARGEAPKAKRTDIRNGRAVSIWDRAELAAWHDSRPRVAKA